MGCMASKGTENENEGKKETTKKEEFSWDKRPKLDPKDFILSKRKGETVIKKPG